jgi:hypothetical protein
VRVPISKVYRAFPELDRFDDGQCELFVHQASRGSLRRRAVAAAMQVLAASCAFMAWMFAFAVGRAIVSGLHLRGAAEGIATLGGIVGFVLVPALAALIARDVWLRRSIRARLVSARCPGCEYSLLGLPVTMGVAVCPECGEQLDLERMGLTPKDLMATDGVAEVA